MERIDCILFLLISITTFVAICVERPICQAGKEWVNLANHHQQQDGVPKFTKTTPAVTFMLPTVYETVQTSEPALIDLPFHIHTNICIFQYFGFFNILWWIVIATTTSKSNNTSLWRRALLYIGIIFSSANLYGLVTPILAVFIFGADYGDNDYPIANWDEYLLNNTAHLMTPTLVIVRIIQLLEGNDKDAVQTGNNQKVKNR